MELTIIEQNGWKKSIEFEKAIIRIGSAPTNDIQLTSPEIAPVQLQLHYLRDNPSTCKVLNLGSDVVVWQNHSQAVLPPYAITHISNGDEIVLGEYRVQFKLPFAASMISESSSIQANLSFPDATLRMNQAAVGILSLKNTGLHSACQFEVELHGLPPDCMQVDPVPLLYPGAQEDVKVQLFHRKLYPAAGAQELIVKVSSPASYPGEQVVIRQGIYVAPALEHSIEIFDDMVRKEKKEGEQVLASPTIVPANVSTPVKASHAAAPVMPPTPVAPEPKVQPVPIETAAVDFVEENPSPALDPPKPVVPDKPKERVPEVRKQPAPDIPSKSPAPPVSQKHNLKEERKEEIRSVPVQKMPEDSLQLPAKPRVVRSPSDDFWDEE